MDDIKLCPKCQSYKSIENFSKDRSKKDKLKYVCKTCVKEYIKNNKLKISEYKKFKHKLNPARQMLSEAKKRAAKKGLIFNIELQDLCIPAVCPVLGLSLTTGDGYLHETSPTLDRIIPEKGYVKDNIAIISMRANRIKNNASLEELKKLVHWLETNVKE